VTEWVACLYALIPIRRSKRLRVHIWPDLAGHRWRIGLPRIFPVPGPGGRSRGT